MTVSLLCLKCNFHMYIAYEDPCDGLGVTSPHNPSGLTALFMCMLAAGIRHLQLCVLPLEPSHRLLPPADLRPGRGSGARLTGEDAALPKRWEHVHTSTLLVPPLCILTQSGATEPMLKKNELFVCCTLNRFWLSPKKSARCDLLEIFISAANMWSTCEVDLTLICN